jgi:hypothetical protein
LKIELENVEVVPPVTDTALPEYKESEQHTAPKKQVNPPQE